MDAVEAALAYAAKWRGDVVAPASTAAHIVALADEVERLRPIETAAAELRRVADVEIIIGADHSAVWALHHALNGGA